MWVVVSGLFLICLAFHLPTQSRGNFLAPLQVEAQCLVLAYL